MRAIRNGNYNSVKKRGASAPLKGVKMTELEKIEPKKTVLKIGGRERELKFNFSAWKEIEKKYGSVNNIDALVKDMNDKPFQTLPEIVYIALTDKEGLEKETCLDEFGMKEMQHIINAVAQALTDSLPTDLNKKKAVKK